MYSLVVIFINVYFISLGLILVSGFFRQRGKERIYANGENTINPQDIVVLVPFRNEESRIAPLLKSIEQLTIRPSRFVFIDDHSSDGTVTLIQEVLGNKGIEVYSLPDDSKGKKAALRYAIGKVSERYILTMDADITITSTYFEEIAVLEEADMYVLPAIMKAQRIDHYLYEIDLLLVNAANAGLAGILRPIVASGANLLYRRDTFNNVDDLDSHAHAASGDDTYLLRDFRKNDCDVRLHTNPSLAITTETPQSFREFIDQRLRWIGKTGDLKDHLSTSLAVLQSLLTFTFLALCIVFAVKGMWLGLLYLYCLKTAFDLLLFLPYFARVKRMVPWMLIPLYEFFFPVYSLIIVVLLFTYKPKWKGREIYSK